MLTIIVAIAIVLQASLSIAVYKQKRDSVTNLSFVTLSLGGMLWAAANYFYTLNPTSDYAFLLIRIIMFFVVVQNTSFYIFATNYPKHTLGLSRRFFRGYLLTSVCVAIVTLLPLVFNSIKIDNGQTIPNPGPLIPVFIMHAIFSIGLGIRSLVIKTINSVIEERRKIVFILTASFLNSVIVPITNFLTTLALQTTFFAKISPMYTFAFLSIIAYAMLRYRLFDIRLVVARATVYILTIALFLAGYVAVIASINRLILKDTGGGLAIQIMYAIVAVFSAPLLISLKRFFDKWSARIFYRDAYDPQVFIDRLNQVLTSSADINSLLTSCAAIIQENLKTSFCAFFIRETSYYPNRILGTEIDEKKFNKVDEIQELSAKVGDRVFSTELSQGSTVETNLSMLLQSNDISVLVRLVNTLDYELKGVGDIFIGPKKNGSSYNKQDLKILEIIANELVIAVENVLRYEEIDKFNVTLQQKIDDATKELKRTNEKLIALDEAKDEFVSMASHQLRTPLTSIKGYVSMVAEEDMGKLNKDQKKMLGQALFSSQRMVYLISDLLNVSRLKTGKFVIEPKPVHLPTVTESELTQLHEGAAAKDITLTYHGPNEFPILYLDEMKIRQVIMNFTDNAIYYTPSGGKITLSLKESPHSIEFTVKDTGIGVPKDERHKLFTKFYRADNAKQARPDGTGLGLFMAKKVIIAQGGSIVFDSVEGKGSTFGFNFPKSAVKIPEGVVVDEKKVMTSVGSEAMPEPSLED